MQQPEKKRKRIEEIEEKNEINESDKFVSSNVIDALPYTDTVYSDFDKEMALRLIEQEMRTFKPRDYLAHLPPAPKVNFESPILQNEFQRVSQRLPMRTLNNTRYQVSQPDESDKNNLEAWEKALQNAKSQLEHQDLRLLNLDLLDEYGANAWLTHNNMLETMHSKLQQSLNEIKSQIEEINKIRKIEQSKTGELLDSMKNKWTTLIHKNLEIEQACQQLEIVLDQNHKTLNHQ